MATDTQTNQEQLLDMVRRIAESLTGTSFDEVDEDEVRDSLDHSFHMDWLGDEQEDSKEITPTEADYQQAIEAAHDAHVTAYDIRITARQRRSDTRLPRHGCRWRA